MDLPSSRQRRRSAEKSYKVMSSRKHRKQLRKIVPIQLHSVRAARMFFIKETVTERDKELASYEQLSIDEMRIAMGCMSYRYFGSAFDEFLSWTFGIIKLSFDLPERKGKLRAKDLIVKRVQTK